RPHYTLFPYTTLFRSHGDHRIDRSRDIGARRQRIRLVDGPIYARCEAGQEAGTGVATRGKSQGANPRRVDTIDAGSMPDEAHGTDRKSTRLNSSHRTI